MPAPPLGVQEARAATRVQQASVALAALQGDLALRMARTVLMALCLTVQWAMAATVAQEHLHH